MSKVFVVDTNKQPLYPVHPGRARLLLAQGKAAVFRRYPFTLVLKSAGESPQVEPLRVKLDPGSKVTGLAIVNDVSGEVVFAAELLHRGQAIKKAKGVPLQIEHIHPRAKLGTDRISNLTLACEPCNIKKGTQDVQVFLANKPDVLKRILAQAKAPLKDAAAVNTIRWTLFERLKALGMPIECGSGGLTKFNRTMRGLPKEHWMDAACVGKNTPEQLHTAGVVPLLTTANGYGNRQMCLMNKHGFPRTKPKQAQSVKGYQTGDIVKAVVTQGKKVGTYVGRVAVRATGFFNITTEAGTIEGIHHRYCRLIYRADGYSYQFGRRAAFPPVA